MPGKSSGKSGSGSRGRSAISGRFVKQSTVKRSPKTTVNESTKEGQEEVIERPGGFLGTFPVPRNLRDLALDKEQPCHCHRDQHEGHGKDKENPRNK